MDFDSQGALVLSVSLGQNKKWHVSLLDFSQPLASFDNPQAACVWAIAVAKPKRGKVLVEELAAPLPASPHGNAPETFKFSIPVVWTDSQDSRINFAAAKSRF